MPELVGILIAIMITVIGMMFARSSLAMRYYFIVIALLGIALFFTARYAHSAEDWDTVSKVEFGVFITLQAIDAAQTRRALAQPDRYEEANPVFGRHPRIGTVIAVKLLAASGVYYMADRMNVNDRRLLLGGLDAVSFMIDRHNAMIGLGWNF
jgi:hypothetical protein